MSSTLKYDSSGRPALPADEVHVWCAVLDLASPEVARLEETLAKDERERAARFHFENDRKNFVVARGALRNILGRYLDRDPAGVPFSYGPCGKPALFLDSKRPQLHFNLAHCSDYALYAITRNREVGIDVERIEQDRDYLEVARRFFSRNEFSALCILPISARIEAFFGGWTCKEAYAKACGKGLRCLDGFDLSLDARPPLELSDGRGRTWSLHTLIPAPGYVAAIVVQGSDCKPRLYQWRPICEPRELPLEAIAGRFGPISI